MSNAVLPDEGIADQLMYLLSSDIMGVLPWDLMLWVNDIEPDNETVYADLIEAKFYGYHRVTLSRNNWQTPTVLDGCATSISGTAPIVWTVAPGRIETVYGVAYVDRLSKLIRYVQRFDDGDIRVTEPHAQLVLWPQYTLTSAACGNGRRARGMRAAQRRKGLKP